MPGRYYYAHFVGGPEHGKSRMVYMQNNEPEEELVFTTMNGHVLDSIVNRTITQVDESLYSRVVYVKLKEMGHPDYRMHYIYEYIHADSPEEFIKESIRQEGRDILARDLAAMRQIRG
jgi:ACT domain-containing protein